uniref:Cellular repressor of E1A stimulateds 2 n=1 Tax=Podarcis muralis TaxID=64176 RepID=A0A670IAA2_PODMU
TAVQEQPRAAACPGWLSWALLWCSLALAPAGGYVIVNSVSWSVTNEVEEELHSSSNEEVLPALLEDTTGDEGPGRGRRAEAELVPSRMFSYRRASAKGGTESLAPPRASGQGGPVPDPFQLVSIRGAPFGNCLSISDGPKDNSTGIPFFYVTPKDNTVADLMKNSVASLTLPEAEGDICRKTIVDPDDPRCVRLILTGQMVTVPLEEMEFAKQALFSRHPAMRKWPRNYEWFFMKMNIEHVWLQNWYGGIAAIAVEEYFKAVPSKA